MMGPDPDGLGGNVGNFAREDFTLLNLSRSSSTPSSSDELFAHHQHPLPPNNPNKKKRFRLKRKGGYSVRQNRLTEDSSQSHSRGVSPFGSALGSSSTVIYAFVLLLLCWSATLSWLVFSLRNQLVTTNTNLAASEAVTKDLPMELTKMNQTIQILQTNVTELASLVAALQTQLSNSEKNLTETNGLLKDLKKDLALLGSKEAELTAKVDKLENAVPKVTNAVAADGTGGPTGKVSN